MEGGGGGNNYGVQRPCRCRDNSVVALQRIHVIFCDLFDWLDELWNKAKPQERKKVKQSHHDPGLVFIKGPGKLEPAKQWTFESPGEEGGNPLAVFVIFLAVLHRKTLLLGYGEKDVEGYESH